MFTGVVGNLYYLIAKNNNLIKYNTVAVYNAIKIAEDIEEEGKKLATIEIKRRNIASEEEFNNFIKNTDDEHITNVYNEMKELLTNLQKQKDINNTLIKQRLFFTNKMINVIKPSKSVNTYNAY